MKKIEDMLIQESVKIIEQVIGREYGQLPEIIDHGLIKFVKNFSMKKLNGRVLMSIANKVSGVKAHGQYDPKTRTFINYTDAHTDLELHLGTDIHELTHAYTHRENDTYSIVSKKILNSIKKKHTQIENIISQYLCMNSIWEGIAYYVQIEGLKIAEEKGLIKNRSGPIIQNHLLTGRTSKNAIVPDINFLEQVIWNSKDIERKILTKKALDVMKGFIDYKKYDMILGYSYVKLGMLKGAQITDFIYEPPSEITEIYDSLEQYIHDYSALTRKISIIH